MPSDYCDRTQLRNYLDLEATATGDDALLDDLIQRASRGIDRFCRRWFYVWTDTREYEYPGRSKLYLDADLLGCTTLTIDGTANTDYKLRPQNTDVKLWIEMTLGSGSVFEWSDTPQDAVTVLGEWGYHDDYANAWETSGATVSDNPYVASTATLNVSDGTKFAIRQTIKADSEQFLITAISSNALTVKPALNGTTAAGHTLATAISIYRPPEDIVHQAIRTAAWYYKQKDAPFGQTATPSLGVVVTPLRLPPDVESALMMYRKGPL